MADSLGVKSFTLNITEGKIAFSSPDNHAFINAFTRTIQKSLHLGLGIISSVSVGSSGTSLCFVLILHFSGPHSNSEMHKHLGMIADIPLMNARNCMEGSKCGSLVISLISHRTSPMKLDLLSLIVRPFTGLSLTRPQCTASCLSTRY